MTNWSKVRKFVHRKTLFCAAAVVEDGKIRLFPIGSLKVGRDSHSLYFEMFARPVAEGSPITFLAVDAGILFWLRSLILGRFLHPPALRLEGIVGQKREATPREREGWMKRVGWLLKTKGGKKLWSRPKFVREIQFTEARAVRLGSMTGHLKDWVEQE